MRAFLVAPVLLLLAAAPAAAADDALSVLLLGPAEPPPAQSPGRGPPGQLAMRPLAPADLLRSPPGLVVLVEGRPRVLVDPGPGTLAAAGAAGLDISMLGVVLLTSTRPGALSELPVLLTQGGGPTGALRLVGPGAVATWPSTSRWADALFGPSGLYQAALHAPRPAVEEVRGTAERRSMLVDGVELRARATAEGAVFRLSRAGAVLVLAGEPGPGSVSALGALAAGAGLLVAGCPTEASVRSLADVASRARVRKLLVVSAADPVRGAMAEARGVLGRAAPEVTWASSGRHGLGAAPVAAGAPVGGCQADAECGPGRLCMGCGGDSPKECVAGCRSKADCGPGRACVEVQCVRCPCPAQCVGQ